MASISDILKREELQNPRIYLHKVGIFGRPINIRLTRLYRGR